MQRLESNYRAPPDSFKETLLLELEGFQVPGITNSLAIANQPSNLMQPSTRMFYSLLTSERSRKHEEPS